MCSKHPSLEATETCAFCFAEYVGMGGDVEMTDLTMLFDMLQHVFNQQNNGSLLQHLLSCLGPALFRLLVVSSSSAASVLLEEIMVFCIHNNANEASIEVWRTCAMECLAENIGGTKLPVLQLTYLLFSRDEEITLLLALANDVECCAFVWSRIHEVMMENVENVIQVILQHPIELLFAQAIDLQDVNASVCLQLFLQHVGGGDNVCLLASHEHFASFLCLPLPSSMIIVSQTLTSIFPLPIAIQCSEVLVRRVLAEFELHGQQDCIVHALELLIQTQPAPSCAHDLAVAMHTFNADSRARMYHALSTASTYWLQGASGDVLVDLLCSNANDHQSLCLLLHTQGNEARDLNIVCEFAHRIRDLMSNDDGDGMTNAVSLLCEIARIKLTSSSPDHLIALGLTLFAELAWWYMEDDDDNHRLSIEFHDFLSSVLLLDASHIGIKMCAIAIQQSGYLKRSLNWVHELGIDRVKHLLQCVLQLADFPLFLLLDEFNFALRDDVSRHLERVGSEVTLCVVCALVWDTHNAAVAATIDDSQLRAWVVPYSPSRTMSGTALVYLLLLCCRNPELLRSACIMFNALANDVQTFIVTCLLNMTCLRNKAVRISTLELVCCDLGFDVLDMLASWIQQDALLEIVLESHVLPLPLFTCIVNGMDTQLILTVMLNHPIVDMAAPKLGVLLHKLLSQSSFTLEQLMVLDGLAIHANNQGLLCDIHMKDINLPTSVEGVQARASLLRLVKHSLEEEPWAVQCAVMERMTTHHYHYGDIDWVCICLQQQPPCLKQVPIWRKLAINAFCGVTGLRERICIAETLLLDYNTLPTDAVDFQRVYDKAMALYVIDGQTIGLRLVARLSTYVDECVGEAYVSQSIYSTIAAAERPCTLLVLLVAMNGGERPVSNAVMQQISKHVAHVHAISDERAILQLLLVVAMVLHRVVVVQQQQMKTQLEALQYRFTIKRDSLEDNDDDVALLLHAAQFGWKLTKPFANHVLTLSLQFIDMDRLTAGRRIAKFCQGLMDSCKI